MEKEMEISWHLKIQETQCMQQKHIRAPYMPKRLGWSPQNRRAKERALEVESAAHIATLPDTHKAYTQEWLM
ncbi:hypothetical protein AA18889_1652 [Acetobacter senegalensis DSM 18889]|nr:hypothetical protein AA18889_1652 [Acetobacter senegalensis DSM 18889]